MGLFSEAPRIPEPHVTRTLTTSQQVYHPGSHVSGTLTLQSPMPRRIVRAEASFYGLCWTHAWRSESSGTGDNKTSETINYEDKVDLFRHAQVSEKSFVANPGENFSWPFDFVFPSETTNSRGEVYRKQTACSPLYQVLPHSLPPTFAYDLSHSTYAHVEYNVEAVVHFEDTTEPFTVKFEQLQFSPFPFQGPISAPFVEFVRDMVKYSSSRLVGQEKSFQGSIRDRFSSTTPSLDIRMKASILPAAKTGSSFSLFVCTELSNLSDPYAISMPEVRLRIKSLTLLKQITLRAMRVDGRSFWNEVEEKHTDKLHLNALPETHSVQPRINDQKQFICPAAFEARMPGDVCPVFSTVSINYACGLKAVVEGEICGKSSEHQFEMFGLKVFAG